jgi:hypothetical protein
VLRKFWFVPVFGAAAAGLAVTGWPGPARDPATLINRLDVVAVPVMLAVLPWLCHRVFGPAAGGWLMRVVRGLGCAAVFALVLVKAIVERFEYASLRGPSWLAGLWAGEIVFLVLVAGYLTWLLAMTSQRPPATRAALSVGMAAGTGAGLMVFVLPPVGNPLHMPHGWLTVMHGLARGVTAPLVLGAGVAAGVLAARRAAGRSGRPSTDDAPARQGVVAGLCAGAAAALLVSLAGISAAALLPHAAEPFRSVLPNLRHIPRSVYAFEVSLSRSAAGYLLVLLFFPFLGAGLGAWGGLCASDRPGGPGGGGGGGGGGGAPEPPPPPPAGGRRLDQDRGPGILAGYLIELPELASLSGEQGGEPHRQEKVPVSGV